MAAALALGGGGCAVLGPAPADDMMAIRPPHKPPTPRVAHSQSAPPLVTARKPPDRPVVPTPPAASLPVERLTGLGEDEVRRLLGAPTEVKDQPPAVVWAYDSVECRLELSFYMDVASEAFKVLTSQTTPKGRDGPAGDACARLFRTAAR